MEPSRCFALFMAAYFHCTVAALKIVLARGNVLVIFFPLSGLLSIGVLVISFFLSG